jgi:hypothetical protein
MMSDEATPLAVSLAKDFTSLIRKVEPKWSKAFLRFRSNDSVAESKASYMFPDGVEIVDVLQHTEFFNAATARGKQLLAALGKSAGLFVLIADSNFDYEIKFEYKNMDKWKISKMKGGTGVPEGLE